jgi:hypothetical protein
MLVFGALAESIRAMVMPVHKIILFLKRKPGMSVQDFRDYYESHHRLLAEKYSKGVARYVRRYIEPVAGGTAEALGDELGFDVITEVWIADRAMFEQVGAFLARNAPPPDVLEDELKLFDRAKSRVATVVEFESDVSTFA